MADHTVVVRPPRTEDAEAMGALHVRAWQAAYRGVMPDEYLDGLRAADREAMWRSAIERTTAGLLVAQADGVVVGFAAFGAEAIDDAVPPPAGQPPRGELYAINLHPDSWARGIGRAMLQRVTEGLRSDGFVRAVLWVVPQNERAIALYRSDGWTPDGAVRSEELLGVSVDEARYVRTLS